MKFSISITNQLNKYTCGLLLIILFCFVSGINAKAALSAEDVYIEQQDEHEDYMLFEDKSFSQQKEIEKEKELAKYCEKYFSDQDVYELAQVMMAEGGNLDYTECACIAWAVLNRVDMDESTLHDVIRVPNQYAFFEWMEPNDQCLFLAKDVLTIWALEKEYPDTEGRVLPEDYIYWSGDGYHNWFRNAFQWPYDEWDYSLPSPYKE